MGYKYKPPKQNFDGVRLIDKETGKKLTVAMLVVVAMIFFFYVGTSATGNVAKTESLQSDVESLRTNLEMAKDDRTECQNNLDQKETELAQCEEFKDQNRAEISDCEKTKNEFKKSTDELGQLLSSCSQEREDYKTKYTQLSGVFDRVTANAAQEMCCIGQKNKTIKWDIVDNSIVCGEGKNAVFCA